METHFTDVALAVANSVANGAAEAALPPFAPGTKTLIGCPVCVSQHPGCGMVRMSPMSIFDASTRPLIDATCSTVATVNGAAVHFVCDTIAPSVSPETTVCVWQSPFGKAAHDASVVGGAVGADVVPAGGGAAVVPGHVCADADEAPQSHVASPNGHCGEKGKRLR